MEKKKEVRKVILVFISLFILISAASSVSAVRLPTVGGDSGSWGTILDTFLNVSHNESGELRNDTVSTLQIIDGTITDRDISDATNLTLGERITFTLGEIIDNIVNGWITITGGLNVTNNLEVNGTISSRIQDTSNQSTTDVLILDHTSSNPVGDTIGTGILLRAEDTAGDTESVGRIEGILTNATNGSEATALTFSTGTGNGSVTLTERLRIASSGIDVTGNVTADYFIGNGSQVTDIVYANETAWWASLSGWVGNWFYKSGNDLAFNETRLNATIDARENDTTYTAGEGITLTGTRFNFSNTYGDARYYAQAAALAQFMNLSDDNHANWTIVYNGWLNNFSRWDIAYYGYTNNASALIAGANGWTGNATDQINSAASVIANQTNWTYALVYLLSLDNNINATFDSWNANHSRWDSTSLSVNANQSDWLGLWDTLDTPANIALDDLNSTLGGSKTFSLPDNSTLIWELGGLNTSIQIWNGNINFTNGSVKADNINDVTWDYTNVYLLSLDDNINATFDSWSANHSIWDSTSLSVNTNQTTWFDGAQGWINNATAEISATLSVLANQTNWTYALVYLLSLDNNINATFDSWNANHTNWDSAAANVEANDSAWATDTTYTADESYINLVSTQFNLNETVLNATIDVRSGNVSGAGTTNTFAKFTAGDTISNSLITDDGTIVAVNTNDLVINTSSGNVGIGTATPEAKLDVASGPSVIPLILTRYSDGAFGTYLSGRFSRNATVGVNTIVQDGDEVFGLDAYGANGTDFIPLGRIMFSVDGTPGASNDMPGRIHFYTTPDGSATLVERMRIDNSGNVGIGDTSPQNELSVTGSADISSSLRIGSAGTPSHTLDVNGFSFLRSSGGVIIIVRQDSDGTTAIAVQNSSGTTTIALVPSGDSYFNSGNVGIGTTSPGVRLEVSDATTHAYLEISSSATNLDAASRYYDGTTRWTTGLQGNAADAGDYTIREAGVANHFVIEKTSGNVGIGTVGPTATLHINSSSAGGAFFIENTTGTSLFFVNGTSGYVGIGTDVPGAKLEIAKIATGADEDALKIGVDGEYGASIKFFDDDVESSEHFKITFDAGTEDLRFHSDSKDDILYLTQDGKVGIKTSNPGHAFEVNGTMNVINGNGYRIGGWAIIGQDGTGNKNYLFSSIDSLSIRNWQDDTDLVTILNGGNVGIGTVTPSYPLEVSGNSSGISIYTEANISVDGIIDRTSFPDEYYDALTAVKKIKSDGKGKLDHSTLPDFAKASYKIPIRGKKRIEEGIFNQSTDKTVELTEEVTGRNLGNMVSLNTKAIQQLAEIVGSRSVDIGTATPEAPIPIKEMLNESERPSNQRLEETSKTKGPHSKTYGVGQAKIFAGDTEVIIVFEEDYENAPIVTITPLEFVDGGYKVTEKTTTGFSIALQNVQDKDIVFDWHALSSVDAQISQSDGRTEEGPVNETPEKLSPPVPALPTENGSIIESNVTITNGSEDAGGNLVTGGVILETSLLNWLKGLFSW